LEALARDALGASADTATPCEIVVVDDGSFDGTASMVSELAADAKKLTELGKTVSPVEMRYVHQENRGAAAARNNGLRHATGQIVLFIDSDIMAAPGLLGQHIRSHLANHTFDGNLAVLGQILLAPGVPNTPMNLNHVIHLWRDLHDGQELGWRYFATGNLSLERTFLLDNGLWFDESFSSAGLEDTELGYRACKQGLRIIYNAQAVGYHNHNLTLQSFTRQNWSYGQTLAVLHHRYPEMRGTLASYLPFSWRNPPGRIARDMVRPLLLNRLSAAVLVRRAQAAERAGSCASAAVICRIGNYYERLGYRRRCAQGLSVLPKTDTPT
jgi:glycosyltransferase involved in cell wall biosynthesis